MCFCALQANAASELGGAMYSIQPSISIQDRTALNVADDVFSIGDLFLSLVNMSLNTANQGGCMYVTGNGANVTAVNSYFDRYSFSWQVMAHGPLVSPDSSCNKFKPELGGVQCIQFAWLTWKASLYA